MVSGPGKSKANFLTMNKQAELFEKSDHGVAGKQSAEEYGTIVLLFWILKCRGRK